MKFLPFFTKLLFVCVFLLMFEPSPAQTNPVVTLTDTVNFAFTGSIQKWVVPQGVSQVTITAAGAAGGKGPGGGNGGAGAILKGVCVTYPGDTLTIVVGGKGTDALSNNTAYGAGGGGGTYVYDISHKDSLLIVAGGGGGNWGCSGNSFNGDTTATCNNDSLCGTGGPGGWGGQPSAGGAGWNSDGGDATNNSNYGTAPGGKCKANGFIGGIGNRLFAGGGFGGGGSAGYSSPGGGGGYNGGGGGSDGCGNGGFGGTSFLQGTRVGVSNPYNTGDGYVMITCNFSGPLSNLHNAAICRGDTIRFNANIGGGNWSSSNANIAKIGSTGLVTGVFPGIATVSYSLNGNTDTAVVTVSSMPTISGASYCFIGLTDQLTSSSPPLFGQWSSDDTTIAQLVIPGTIIGKRAGYANIKFKYMGCTAVFREHVVQHVSDLRNRTVCAGDTIQFSANTFGGLWSSADTAIVKINANGIVKGISSGSTTVRYVVNGITDTAIVSVNPKLTINGSSSCYVGDTVHLRLSRPVSGAWSSDDTTIATVQLGVVTGIREGITNIKYNSICTAVIADTVRQHVSNLRDCSVCAGDTIQFTANTVGGVWSSDDTAFVKINANGIIMGISPGSATVRYVVNGLADTARISVKIKPTIIGNSSCYAGATAQLVAFPKNGIWSLNDTAIAKINPVGMVTGIAEGVVKINYTYNGCQTLKFDSIISGMPWANVGPQFVTDNSAKYSSFAIDGNGTPYILFSDNSQNGRATMMKYTGSGWMLVGKAGFTANPVSYTSIAFDAFNNPYVAYCDDSNNGRVSVLSIMYPIVGPPFLCVGDSYQFSNPTSEGKWSVSSSEIAAIDSLTGLVTAKSSGNVIISYKTKNTCATTFLKIANLAVKDTTICAGDTIVLSVSGFSRYSWSGQGIVDIAGNSAKYVNNIAGTYTVSVAGISDSGYSCSKSCIITVNGKPSGLSANSYFDLDSLQVDLKATCVGTISTYNWSSSLLSQPVLSQNIQVANPPIDSIVTYIVTAVDKNRCSSKDTIQIANFKIIHMKKGETQSVPPNAETPLFPGFKVPPVAVLIGGNSIRADNVGNQSFCCLKEKGGIKQSFFIVVDP